MFCAISSSNQPLESKMTMIVTKENQCNCMIYNMLVDSIVNQKKFNKY